MVKHFFSKGWMYISSAITFVALFLYALLQRNKKKQAEDRADNKEKAQRLSREVDNAVQEQRQEAVENEERVGRDVSRRRAGLNNNRLRNTK